MYNEAVSAAIVGVLVAFLVWVHIPKNAVDAQTGKGVRVGATVIKSFLISGAIAYALFYFFGDPGTDDVLENIIPGEPDF